MKIVYYQDIMLGYVTIEKNELKVREYEIYQGYYCGICKSIGRRYGQIPRLVLSYDAVFLALVLGALSAEADTMSRQHCIVHHIDKKPVIASTTSLNYAADVMIILAYHKFLDDWKDERSKVGLAGKTALACTYHKLCRVYPDLCRGIEEALQRLSSLEEEKSDALDQTAEVFADIMELLFTGYKPAEKQNRILAQLGRNLGRWIYTVDALDDYEKDLAAGSYNPLIYRKNSLEGIEDLLYNYLAETANAYDLLDLQKNRGILENIIFMGIRTQTDLILRERIQHE